MNYPAFFDQVPTITVHDGLAQFLGAVDDGLMTYHYIDAVKLAGHSCPTVAGAYLLTRRALQALYPDQIPERGGLEIAFSAPVEQGVIGVISNVVGLITGAAGPGGFKGIGGQYCRKDLLEFDARFDGEVRFVRRDNGAAIQLGMDMSRVSSDPRMMTLLQKTLNGTGKAEDAKEFGRLWQERVRKILIDHADDPEVIFVTD